MRTLITILLFVSLFNSSYGSSILDDRTLTERFFQGEVGTIFTCKILTFSVTNRPNNMIHSNSPINGSATAEIIEIYFGRVDTNIVEISSSSRLTIGMTYLIYTRGNGYNFILSGKGSKQVTENPAISNELSVLKQFSEIFKNKYSGKVTVKSYKNIILAKGRYKNGKPIKKWKHYYQNGIIKAEYDLTKNITSQYFSNGYIKSRKVITKNIMYYEQFSEIVCGQLTFTDKEVKNDSGLTMTVSEYYDNGNKKNLSSQTVINIKGNGGSYSSGKTGEYREYYENGKLKLQGQYETNKRIGLWKWYHENGEFNTEFDYKNGTDE